MCSLVSNRNLSSCFVHMSSSQVSWRRIACGDGIVYSITDAVAICSLSFWVPGCQHTVDYEIQRNLLTMVMKVYETAALDTNINVNNWWLPCMCNIISGSITWYKPSRYPRNWGEGIQFGVVVSVVMNGICKHSIFWWPMTSLDWHIWSDKEIKSLWIWDVLCEQK